MDCIYCGNKTRVSNSRPSKTSKSTWRRRACTSCQAIFTTREQIELSNSLRVKKANGLEPFYRDRLFINVYESLSHRKTPYKDAGGLTDTVTARLISESKNGLLTTTAIIDEVTKVLKRFDKASATHYTAHHPY